LRLARATCPRRRGEPPFPPVDAAPLTFYRIVLPTVDVSNARLRDAR
jgi:hypothetical protein